MTRAALAGTFASPAGRIGEAQAWRGRARTTGLVALAALLALYVCGLSTGALGAPMLGVALVLGLPHGAADTGSPVLTSRGHAVWAAGLAGYGAVAIAVYLLWWVAPTPVLLALLGLAVAHFGAADVEHRAIRGVERTATALALGGLPVVLPLALHGDVVRPILVDLTGGHPDVVVVVARLALVVVAVATVATVAFARRSRQWTAAVEPVLLAATFALLGPLVAFAAYYGLWHSLRQAVTTVDETAGRLGIGMGHAARLVLRRAALPSVAVVVAGLALAGSGHLPVLATGLVVVLCLTVPHSLLAAASTAFGARDTIPLERQ